MSLTRYLKAKRYYLIENNVEKSISKQEISKRIANVDGFLGPIREKTMFYDFVDDPHDIPCVAIPLILFFEATEEEFLEQMKQLHEQVMEESKAIKREKLEPMEDGKTYGKKVFEHHAKKLDQEDDIREYTRAMQSDVMTEIWRVIEQDASKPLYINRNFYIVICWQVKRIGQGFAYPTISRVSCPTPTPQQSVFKYQRLTGDLKFMWTLGKQDQIDDYAAHSSEYLNTDEANSCKFAVLYKNGKLLEWVKKENGEKKDAIIKITPPPELIH